MNWSKYLSSAFNSIAKKKLRNSKLDKRKTISQIKKYVKLKQYIFKEWTPFLQEKKDGGYRPLISPPIKDRILLKALADYCSNLLKPVFSKIDDISFAYQKGKGPREALIKLKSQFNHGEAIIKLDIQKFFNNINKDIVIDLLKNFMPDEYAMSLIEKSLYPKLTHNEAYDLAMESIQNGIPQGNAVSAVLSNLYLLEFDLLCKSRNLRLIRYADDMVILVENKDKAYEVLNFVEDYLRKERGLSIHPISDGRKTSLYFLPQNPSLKYLGVVFDGNNLFPTLECQAILSKKIKSIAKNNSKTKTAKIKEIRKCVKQWCGYYAFTDLSKNRLKRLSISLNHNCQKYLGPYWSYIDLTEVFNHYKNKQNKKRLSIFDFKNNCHGEEFYWLYAFES